MYKASIGGGAATHTVYRLGIVRFISDLIGPLAAGRGCSPQMMAVLLVHLGSAIPCGFGIGGAREGERSILRRILDQLPEDTLLVADPGYTGFDLLGELHNSGVRFLIRVGRGVRLLTGLGDFQHEGKDISISGPTAGVTVRRCICV